MEVQIIKGLKKPVHPNKGKYDKLVNIAGTLEIDEGFNTGFPADCKQSIYTKLRNERFVVDGAKHTFKFETWRQDGHTWIKRVELK
jgi:hypothetical protein